MISIILALSFVLAMLATVGLYLYRKTINMDKEKAAIFLESKKDTMGARQEQDLNVIIAEKDISLKQTTKLYFTSKLIAAGSILGLIIWNSLFYLEPGYAAHGRTIFGQEFAYTTQGWHFGGWGKYTSWKKYFTVATTDDSTAVASVVNPAYRVRMLDQVDGLLSTTVRYKLPDDTEQFKAIANAYRSAENLLNSELMPPVKETMNATSSLMGAQEYYNGGRTEFANEFDSMMREGIYSIRRVERQVKQLRKNVGSANASKGTEQDAFGENQKVEFVVEKKLGEDGTPIRKRHNFLSWGIRVETAIVTDFLPNNEFDKRMKLKQKASADRAIAREQRIQEEEQKLLAEARGQREVAEAQAAELKVQIQQTTQAETEKQLAITNATKIEESAKIAERTAQTNLRIADLEAKRIKKLADAEAYKKKELMVADGALDKKLGAYVEAQKVWAQAYSQRKVPSIVMGGGGDSNTDASQFQSMLNALLAKDLLVNPNATK